MEEEVLVWCFFVVVFDFTVEIEFTVVNEFPKFDLGYVFFAGWSESALKLNNGDENNIFCDVEIKMNKMT